MTSGNMTYRLMRFVPGASESEPLGEALGLEAGHAAFAAAIATCAPGDRLELTDETGALWYSHEEPVPPVAITFEPTIPDEAPQPAAATPALPAAARE